MALVQEYSAHERRKLALNLCIPQITHVSGSTSTLEVLKAVRSRKFLDNSNVIPAAFKHTLHLLLLLEYSAHERRKLALNLCIPQITHVSGSTSSHSGVSDTDPGSSESGKEQKIP
jgi:hypothetical protein